MPSHPAKVPRFYDLPRLTTLIASVIVALASGTGYVYSAYAPQLGSRLRITHAQLNVVGAAATVGSSICGPILGRIADSRGTRMLFVCAFLFLLGGYSGIRHLYDKGVPDDATSLSTISFGFLVLYGFMTGIGSSCSMTSALNTIAKTFPDHTRASANGLVISGVGLSAFLFSTISHVFYAGNTSAFLLLLALGTSFPMILGLFLIRPIPLPIGEEEIHLDTRYPDEDSSNAPLLEDSGDSVNGDLEENELGEEDGDRDFEMSSSRRRVGGSSRKAAMSPDLLPNVYGKELWTSGDFWLSFSILSLLSGTGLMYIYNVGSIAQALYGYKNPLYNAVEASQWQATQVSWISIMNCTGRLSIGIISDLAKNRFGVPRSYCVVLVAFLFFVSQVTTASIGDIKNLWIASVLLGLAYGSLWSLFINVCLEWFGMPHFSENWGYLSMSYMGAGNLFSIIFGWNFDAHEDTPPPVTGNDSIPPSTSAGLTRASSTHADLRCSQGLKCYVDTIYMTIALTIISMILSLWAGWRDQRRIRRAREGVLGM